MSAATDAKLANRILRGLVYGAVAGVLVLLLAPHVPGLHDGARWLATNVFDPLGPGLPADALFRRDPARLRVVGGRRGAARRLSDLGPLAGRTFALFFANMAIAVDARAC